jgi:integrase
MDNTKKKAGWQFLVEINKDYVIKTPISQEEIREQVQQFLSSKGRLNEFKSVLEKLSSDIKDSTKIIKKSKIPSKFLADLEFLEEDKIKQKRVIPLEEYVKKLNKTQQKELFQKLAKFILKLWDYGIHETTFKLISNFGIDSNEIVLMDAFEITSNKNVVIKQLKKGSWKKTSKFEKYLSTESAELLIKELIVYLTKENLNKHWKKSLH